MTIKNVGSELMGAQLLNKGYHLYSTTTITISVELGEMMLAKKGTLWYNASRQKSY
jgi:hypothetical protein